MCDLVQRIARPTHSARARAREHQTFDLRWMSQCELLGDHSAEGNADNARAIPADRFEQLSGVVSVVAHRVRSRRFRRLSESALIVCEQVEGGPERRLENARPNAQVAASAADV